MQVEDEEVNRFLSPPDMWRLADDARPFDVTWDSNGQGGTVAASHHGYERLADPVAHRRTCEMTSDGRAFHVRDSVRAQAAHRYTWRFHLAPGATAQRDDQMIIILTAGGGRVFLECEGLPVDACVFETGYASPSYGVRVGITVIRADATFTGARSVVWTFRVEEA